MKTKLNRIMALLTVLMMVFNMVPASALAGEQTLATSEGGGMSMRSAAQSQTGKTINSISVTFTNQSGNLPNTSGNYWIIASADLPYGAGTGYLAVSLADKNISSNPVVVVKKDANNDLFMGQNGNGNPADNSSVTLGIYQLPQYKGVYNYSDGKSYMTTENEAKTINGYKVLGITADPVTGGAANFTVTLGEPESYPVTIDFYDAQAIREGSEGNYTVTGNRTAFQPLRTDEKYYIRAYVRNKSDNSIAGYTLVEVNPSSQNTVSVNLTQFTMTDANSLNENGKTFFYDPEIHTISPGDIRFIADPNNKYSLNSPSYYNVSNTALDNASPDGWEAFANIPSSTGGTTISVRKAKEKEFVVRIVADSREGDIPLTVTDDDKVFLLVVAEHDTTVTSYHLEQVSFDNSGKEIHVDTWYNSNGQLIENEKYTGGEKSVTAYLLKTKPGKSITSIADALEQNNAERLNVGSVLGGYCLTSYDNSHAKESDPDNPDKDLYVDTITLTSPRGTLTRGEIIDDLRNALHFGFYTLNWTGHHVDMESNGAAWSVSTLNTGLKDWGFSGNNLRNNKIKVKKQFVDADGNPVVGRTVTLKLKMITKMDASDGGIGGDNTSEWTETVTTDANGFAETTFNGLYSGTYRVYEVIDGTEIAWNSNTKVTGEGAGRINVSFLDKDGNVIDVQDETSRTNDISLSNINYFNYFGPLSSATDNIIKELITKARAGSGKKFIVQPEDYDRVVGLNASLDASAQAVILKAGTDGAASYNMPADFTSFTSLSQMLATAESSNDVNIININANDIVDYVDVDYDGRFIVFNVDVSSNNGSFKPNVKLHSSEFPNGFIVVNALFNHDGYNWPSRILWNVLNGTEPYAGDIQTGANTSGILLAPNGSVVNLGGNWGGTIIAKNYNHNGSEIHSEQWDDDIAIGETAVQNSIDKTSLYVRKLWNLNGETRWPDGVTVTVHVMNGSQEVANVVLNADKKSHKFDNLPAYDSEWNRITYTITETVSGASENSFNTTITSEDYNNTKRFTITNTDSYTASGNAVLMAKKERTADLPSGNKYSFELYRVDGSTETLLATSDEVDPETTVYFAGNADLVPSGSSYRLVDDLSYNEQQADKTYKYIIKETHPDGAEKKQGTDGLEYYVKDGMWYSAAEHQVEITTSDDGHGTINVSYKEGEKTGNEIHVFVNHYYAEGEETLKAKKAISGKEWPANGKVTFTLAAV